MVGQTFPHAFELSDISRRYGRRWALARISFALPKGESLLLTGHNGSGKSTLLRILATSLSPTLGQLKILGFDARTDQKQIRPLIALLSHDSFLYEDLSAQENLLFLANLLPLPNPKDHVKEALAKVGLSSRANHPVRQFSAGMKKRLSIARLFLKSPKLALLDEPFGELDPEGIALMKQLVGQLIAQGTTVVLATHLVEQGQALCRRRLHLRDGQLSAAA